MLYRRHFQDFLKTYFGFIQGSFSSLTFSYSSGKILQSSFFFFLSTLSVLKLLSCSLFYQHPHHRCHLPGVGQLLSVLPGTGQWRRKNWNLCSMSGCLVASHRKFRDATHKRTFFKLSIQVGGDALPCENLHLLSLSLHPAHSWLGTIKGTADERYPVQRDHTTGAWDRLGVLCGSLLGSLSEG